MPPPATCASPVALTRVCPPPPCLRVARRYETPTVVALSSALGASGDTTHQLVLTYTATFSAPVRRPPLGSWNLVLEGIAGTTEVTSASFSTAEFGTQWVLTLRAQPSVATMNGHGNTSVSLKRDQGASSDPKYKANGTSFALRCVHDQCPPAAAVTFTSLV